MPKIIPVTVGNAPEYDQPDGTLADSGGSGGGVTVSGYTSSGFAVVTGADSSSLSQGGIAIDGSGNVSQINDLGVGGDITVVGTVDGRDVAADGTKLDGIESGADVTDATNVDAAGAVMDGDFSIGGLMTRTGAGTYTTRTITASTGITMTNGSGISGNPVVAVTKRLCFVGPFSYPSSSATANLYLYVGQCYGSGVGGHCIVMPYDGSIVGLWAQVNVTSWTSGNILWRVQHYTPGLGSGDIISGSDAEQTITASGTQKFFDTTFTPGDYTFQAGQGITIRRDILGTATTDDLACGLYVQFDTPGA